MEGHPMLRVGASTDGSGGAIAIYEDGEIKRTIKEGASADDKGKDSAEGGQGEKDGEDD
jgi:hypothetical protein